RMAQAAIVAYVHGGSSSMLSSLARSQGNDMIVRRQYLRVTAADQHKIVGELRLAKQDLAIQTAELDSQKNAARLAAEEAGTAKNLAAQGEDAQRAVLGRVNGEISGLVAEEAARREADQAAQRRLAVVQPPAQNATAPAPLAAAAKNAVAPVEEVVTKVVPSSGRGGAAVAEARKQLGKPYEYGGSGPNSFDCSGLTSWAWRAAGVELSHSAETQWYETTRVSTGAVEPGDLLFYGPSVSGIHHVTMYIGGGEMIEASTTGTPIRIRGWRDGDLVGAGRPG
ncbi:MAG: peptidoglycan DL-endopeptidase CwlO, partial [Actinomycetota bacterium]|nr:peptidoglycan DL-endopeptidase CwlO [Actinomycetota bacterium]